MPIDLAASFARETRQALHIFGNWPPGNVIKPGAFGILEGDLFRPLGNIEEMLGISPEVRRIDHRLQLDFKSAGTSEINLDAKASGDAHASRSGKITTRLAFSRAGSTYFRIKDAAYYTVLNLAKVNHSIMSAFWEGQWPSNYALVHGVFQAASTTIIMSSEDGAEIELEGEAPSGEVLDLADANAKITFKQERSIAFRVIGNAGMTPLICLSQIRPRNRWLSLLGLSEKTISPFFSSRNDSTAPVSDNVLTLLSPAISADDLRDSGIDPSDLLHIVEVETAPDLVSLQPSSSALPSSNSPGTLGSRVAATSTDFSDLLLSLVADGAVQPADLPFILDNHRFFEQNRLAISEKYSPKSWVAALHQTLIAESSLKRLEEQLDKFPDGRFAYVEQMP